MILIAAVIVLASGAGAATQRRLGARAEALSRGVLRAMLFTLVPYIAFVNINRLAIDADIGGGILLAYVALALAGIVAWLVGSRLLALPRPSVGALINSTALANTGYLGLPLSIAVLGRAHLPEAVAYDSLVQAPALLAGGFGVGAVFGTVAGEGLRTRLKTFVTRNPPLLAVIAALVLPHDLVPFVLVEISRVIVYSLLVLGFFVVGVTLAAETAGEGAEALGATDPRGHPAVARIEPISSPRILAVLVLRLLLAPLLLFALALPLIDLPSAYLLLAAMPCGINTLVVAHAYGLDLRLAAGSIAWTTVLVLVVGIPATAVL